LSLEGKREKVIDWDGFENCCIDHQLHCMQQLGAAGGPRYNARSRVSYETSFDSKQPKLEPKLVSTLSETRRLFRLFRFNTETASFGVSIEPKQRKRNRKQTEKEEVGKNISGSPIKN
jgi:hypothetical protein